MELAKLTARADTLGEQAARHDDFADGVRASESAHAMAVTERENAERRADNARAALEAWWTKESELQQAVTGWRLSARERKILEEYSRRMKEKHR